MCCSTLVHLHKALQVRVRVAETGCSPRLKVAISVANGGFVQETPHGSMNGVSKQGAKSACFQRQWRRFLWAEAIDDTGTSNAGKGTIQLENLLNRLEQPGVHLEADSYASILRQCGNSKSLPLGKRIHDAIVRTAQHQDRYLGNLLVEMYGKCGSMEDARAVFDSMRQRNEFSWTIMITAYAQKGHHTEALELFQQMQLEGMKPDRVTYVSILGACSGLAAWGIARGIHQHLISMGLESEVSTGTALVKAYSMCEDMGGAKHAFDQISEKNVLSWNSIIITFADRGHFEEVIELYQRMEAESVRANETTFIKALGACASLGDSAQGKLLHRKVVTNGYDSDIYVANAVLSMYTKCGEIEDASRVLEGMVVKDVVSWNIILAAYAQYGHSRVALELFQKMDSEGVKPSDVTFVNLLRACTNLESLAEGRRIHARIAESGFEMHVTLLNTLVNMYGKCGSLDDARDVFDKMSERNVVSWNAIITGYLQIGDYDEALELYRQMDSEGIKPDDITFVSVLGACASLEALADGRAIHTQVTYRGLDKDGVVATALASMYCACGRLDVARNIFDGNQEKSVVAWTAMISAYCERGLAEDGLQLYGKMQLEGVKPNNVTFLCVVDACGCLETLAQGKSIHAHIIESGCEVEVAVATALVSMYGKCGSLDDARAVFEKMKWRNVCSWTAMIVAYAQHGHEPLAVESFQKMFSEGLKPDEMTFVIALSACASLKSLRHGKSIHDCFLASGLESTTVGNSLINMYGKCGSLNSARRVFDEMSNKTLVSWTSMIAAYAHCGHTKETLELYWKMELQGVKPDAITFVSILYSCSHAGLLKQGRQYFACMQKDHVIMPIAEHYGCMVDLLGRAGRLNDAEELINFMPFQPSIVEWMSLLSACKIHSDAQRGARAAEGVCSVDADYSAPYVMLSNTNAAAGSR